MASDFLACIETNKLQKILSYQRKLCLVVVSIRGAKAPLLKHRIGLSMLEKPDILDELIISHLQEEYGLHVAQLEFLPLGADMGTAV